MVGHYSGKTVSNYVNGVRACHIVHGAAWSLNDIEIEAMLKAAISLTPASAKRDNHEPYTIDLIIAIRDKLNLNDPLDASVYACLTTIFYATARVEEFTVPRLNAFDPNRHITLNGVKDMQDRQSLITTCHGQNLHQEAKTCTGPDKRVCPTQKQPSRTTYESMNPQQISPCSHTATRTTRTDHSQRQFLSKLASATKDVGHAPLQGHRIRIGSTLEYLLWNIPFDVVKVKGRWASDAFLVYLRKHAQVVAPSRSHSA